MEGVTRDWVIKKVVILVIVIIYYLVAFLLVSKCDPRWFGVMWSFPLPLLFITFLNGYCETEMTSYATIIAVAYLLTAILFFMYSFMISSGVNCKLAMVVTFTVWAVSSAIIFFHILK